MKRRKLKLPRYLLGIILVLILAGGGYVLALKLHRNTELRDDQLSVPTLREETSPIPSPIALSTPGLVPTPAPSKQVLDKLVLPVQFLSQAPFGVWDALHEDACEEASLVMVHHYVAKTKITSLEQGDAEIKDLISYEEQHGYGTSITLQQLSAIANQKYSMTTGRIETGVTIENIKKELADGRPVIIPAAGKILPNPNFRNGGPNYHMLVIVGYESGEFITNDPGTRKGEGFRYKYADLINAIHDWDPGNILNGQKAYLVF